jgi:aspartyl-tRNA(Asn)/glutamyl-tRNA(Gln) amidotransferase subunit A
MHTSATLTELIRGLADGEFSSVELTQYYLGRIRQLNESLNAFISVDDDGALTAARTADARRAAGDHVAVTGLPLAHKDIFCTDGLATTCGSKMLANFIAPYDAGVVSRCKAAGMVSLGKTNMDEFAMGSSNETSFFGAVSNPWDLDRVPGGSSGGSAAAVAAGLVPVATGTDTGGSIRQPAAFCGITGLKPTYGRVSRYGMIAFASSLDQGGPMTRTAEDAALMLSVMAGFDERDSTSAQRRDEWINDPAQTLATPAPMRIGLPEEYFAHLEDSGQLDAVRHELEALGHVCTPVSLPYTDAAIAAYYVIAGAEASTNLSRYDGVRFGHRSAHADSLEELYTHSRSEGFGAEVQRRILTGTYALSVGYYDAYYLKAQQIRRLIANDFAKAFETVDVLLTPTTPTAAFARNALTADPVAMYKQDLFTVPSSLAGLPALSMPCGEIDGLPVGAQLIAPAFTENRILALAHQFQQATDWHQRIPELAA